MKTGCRRGLKPVGVVGDRLRAAPLAPALGGWRFAPCAIWRCAPCALTIGMSCGGYPPAAGWAPVSHTASRARSCQYCTSSSSSGCCAGSSCCRLLACCWSCCAAPPPNSGWRSGLGGRWRPRPRPTRSAILGCVGTARTTCFVTQACTCNHFV